MPVVWVLALGWLSGVVINYLADALPKDIFRPHCLLCDHPLPWPAYLAWWKPCPGCGRRRWRHGLNWALTMGLTLALWRWPGPWGFWALWAVAVYTLVVSWLDIEYRLVVRSVVWAGGLLALGLGAWRHGVAMTLLGGATGGAVMAAIYGLAKVYARWKARRGSPLPGGEPAMGLGDVELVINLGLLLGWPGIWAGLTVAIFLAGGFGLLLVLYGLVRWRRWQMDIFMPYGPFLVWAGLLLIWLAR